MSTGLEIQRKSEVDLVVYDRDGRIALAAEVKGMPIDDAAAQLAYLAERVGDVDYFLLADPENFRLYRRGDLTAPILTLHVDELLSFYNPTATGRKLFEFYLTSLADAWLTDLAVDWSERSPKPGWADLRGTGVLERLDGGQTARELEVGGNTLH
jgi:hypothetical protein